VQLTRGPAERYRPGRVLPLAIGTALLVPLAALAVFVTSGQKQAAPPQPAGPAKTPADRAARAMPPGEQSFIAAIERGKAAYEAGASDTEQAAARSDRAGEICRAVPNPHIFAWSGVVDAVSLEAGDAPVVSIEIAPNTRLMTGSGVAGSAAIDPYALPSLSTLQPGQAVAFSGIFQSSRPGDADCYRQTISTPGGAMTAPVFVIGLYGIAAFNGSAPAEPSK
jgi:hypothetical protein